MFRSTVLAALAAALLTACESASPAAACAPACAGRPCGDDGCGGSCGTCSAGTTCSAAGTCDAPPPGCTPSCAGKTCGDDGCGGSCGTCSGGLVCGASASCELPPSPACGGALRCSFEAHTAFEYACAKRGDGTWDCQRTGYVIDWIPGVYQGAYANYDACRIACAGGNSSCGHTDVDYVVECQACEASCVAPTSTEACTLATADACPFPCGCR